MQIETIKQIADLEETPAVTIVCPLDPRQPGNPHDRAVLTGLRDRAVERVGELLHGRAAESLIGRIDDAIGSVDLRHPSRAVALLVSPESSRVIELPTTVDADVFTGDRFVIRDLVSALAYSAPARVLVLSRKKTRCIDLGPDEAVEVLECGFPVEVEAPTEADTPHRDFPLDEHEHEEAVDFVFRAVNRSLAELERRDSRPIVLVGTERDLSYAQATIASSAEVIGRVHGNYERDTPGEVATLVRPVLDDHRDRARRRACAEVREAIGTRAVSGITAVWRAARDGRGRLLLVEEGYHVPARTVDGELDLSPGDGAGDFDAASDAVGAVVRHGGEVAIVQDGDLADLGHVALFTRY